MKDRIKKLRKSLDMTQQEFAERIGVKRNTIGQYEIGRNEPIDTVINLICREFNVNEEWLRNGEGEMFNPAPSDVLDQLADKYKLSNAAYIVVEKFVNLRPEKRKELMEECLRQEGIRRKPGALELLTELKEKKIITAVATATDLQRTEKYLNVIPVLF